MKKKKPKAVKIAVLGPKGTYTEMAARWFFEKTKEGRELLKQAVERGEGAEG